MSKDGTVIEEIELEGKPLYFFGQLEGVSDAMMLHESISRYHAIIYIDIESNAFLVDVGSKIGT